MPRATTLRGHLIELAVVFVGVALAFGVDNVREDLNERRVGAEYLAGIRQDLEADARMLAEQLESRRAQLDQTSTALEFFDGRPGDPGVFFDAYWNAMFIRSVTPNRNTMDEVLNSGNLRLIRDLEVRTGLLELYATYARIFTIEDHIARDIDQYLYDPTFTQVPFEFPGPWEATPENLAALDLLTSSVTVENGLKLIATNLEFGGEGLLYKIEDAVEQVETLLRLIPAG